MGFQATAVQVAEDAKKAQAMAAERGDTKKARNAKKAHLMEDEAEGGVAESLDAGDADERHTFHYFDDYAHPLLSLIHI